MKTTWEFSAEDIADILTANKNTFNYLKNTLSRFFLQVNKEGIDLYFKDTAGIMRYHKNISYINPPTTSKLFAVDFQKFTNSLLRFQNQGSLVTLGDSTLSIIDISNNTTVVKLSATILNEDLDSILQEKEDSKKTMIKYNHSEEMNNTFTLTSNLMNNGNPNNCLAIVDGAIATYADRSVIYKEKCLTDFKEPLVSIHSFLIGFITNTHYLPQAEYYFDFTNNGLFFKSENVQAYLLSEKPDINMPSEKDLKEIRPEKEGNVLKISAMELADSLNFFKGFFERDVWKPITFKLSRKEQKLSYESPVTFVDKPLDNNFNINFETEFTLASSPLQDVLNNLIKKGNDAEIIIREKPEMSGVSIKVEDQDFELILAKLNF